MSDNQRCRYAVIKYAHDPLRHEPINVGVVLWLVEQPHVVRWQFDSTLRRVEKLYPSANPRAVKTALGVFKQLAEQEPETLMTGIGGTGSVIVSEPRAVLCADMDVEICDLFETLVQPAEADADEPREQSRSSRYVRSRMTEFFKKRGVLKQLLSDDVAAKLRSVEGRSGVRHTFDFAYRNGAIHRIEALSFDYGTTKDRVARARSFANLVEDITGAEPEAVIEAVVQVPTDPLEHEAYAQAKKILGVVDIKPIEVETDADVETYCENTIKQLHAHA